MRFAVERLNFGASFVQLLIQPLNGRQGHAVGIEGGNGGGEFLRPQREEKQKAAFNATGMTPKCAGCDMQQA